MNTEKKAEACVKSDDVRMDEACKVMTKMFPHAIRLLQSVGGGDIRPFANEAFAAMKERGEVFDFVDRADLSYWFRKCVDRSGERMRKRIAEMQGEQG